MQDKLKEILNKASMFTTDPDKDWRRLFAALTCIIALVFVWSIFFYTNVQRDIKNSELWRTKGAATITGDQDAELRRLIIEMEEKKKRNDGVVDGSYKAPVQNVGDPSR